MNSDGTPTVTIHTETAAKLNFACHQSSFAFLRELGVENSDSEGRWRTSESHWRRIPPS